MPSVFRLQRATREEESRTDREQHELAPDVSGEHAVEECDAGHDESDELKTARQEIHRTYGVAVSDTTTRVIRSPCSMRSTTSWPETTWPNTV